MTGFNSYEDWAAGHQHFGAVTPAPVLEYLSGKDMVGWHGRIEQQLVDKVEQQEASRNFEYADKLRAFLGLWRQHAITGSINREPVEALEAASQVLAVDDWSLSNYFRNLRDSLRQVIASIEELPYDELTGPGEEPPQRQGAGAPPGQFGPEKEEPEGEPKPGEAGGPQDEFNLDKAVADMSKGSQKPQEQPV